MINKQKNYEKRRISELGKLRLRLVVSSSHANGSNLPLQFTAHLPRGAWTNVFRHLTVAQLTKANPRLVAWLSTSQRGQFARRLAAALPGTAGP